MLSVVALGPVIFTAVSAILLVAFQPDKEGLGSILLAYIIVTAAKALHEVGSQTNFKIPLLSMIMGKNEKGEDNGWDDFFAGRRAGHAVLDVAIKGVVGWLIILREIDVSGETDVLAKEDAQQIFNEIEQDFKIQKSLDESEDGIFIKKVKDPKRPLEYFYKGASQEVLIDKNMTMEQLILAICELDLNNQKHKILKKINRIIENDL